MSVNLRWCYYFPYENHIQRSSKYQIKSLDHKMKATLTYILFEAKCWRIRASHDKTMMYSNNNIVSLLSEDYIVSIIL